MSRIGKKPIPLPKGVTVKANGGHVAVDGPKGKIDFTFSSEIGVLVDEEKREVRVERPTDQKKHRALHGLTRSMIANMVRGVTDPFEKRLEITGVGYGAGIKGSRSASPSASPTRCSSTSRTG